MLRCRVERDNKAIYVLLTLWNLHFLEYIQMIRPFATTTVYRTFVRILC